MGEAKRRQHTGAPSPKRNGRRTSVLIGVVALAALIMTGLYILTKPPTPQDETLPVAGPDTPPFPEDMDRYGVSIGPDDAPVVVREFADYQCPGCANFAEASQRLKREYVESGQVRFVYFDLPLRQHVNAMPAAMAARCAGDQDQYWDMHDRLYENQSEWSDSANPLDIFTRYANDFGLEERRFRRCMTTELHRETIEQSAEVAEQMRVMSTPTVMVDNIRLTRPGWGQLSAVVERELEQEQ
ncbi:Thioredoxin [Marinobacter persicus]|uniref:Thioredoxin n=1 Tax=Marinobacter persicus TaxID=930118 RepID=A0A1I3VN11_9GAMM|nr:thioredoxin domain-containing protein [Marinobacter persicus]GHD50632.1 DSBA oxidoreductase [Marinobacter persicus]SFJ96383.1 Thioredoxin [Marinobacter persicus]